MKNIINLFIFYIGVFVLVLLLNNSVSLNKSGEIYISKGKSTTGVLNLLYDNGYIYDKFAFNLLKRLTSSNIKSGEYKINNDSPWGILRKIHKHDIFYRQITVVEGTTHKQLKQQLSQNPYLSGNVKLNNDILIFANTYNFERGDSVNKLIDDMKSYFVNKSTPIWNNRMKDLPINTIKQAYTLASIIEKETGLKSERAKIASVFINRLNKNMKLQSDPTTIYAVSDGWGKIDRELTRADLRTKSPYNTYYVRGLPPTPIAIVGVESFTASVNPQRTNLYYFVADGTGGHNFAENLLKHNENVAYYRKLKKKDK